MKPVDRLGRFPVCPPDGEWDSRLMEGGGCPSLQPVTVVHENEWFVVRNRGGYFTAEPKEPQLTVLPIVDHDKIVLIRAIRPVLEDCTYELPAGGLKSRQESVYAGAARELAEETGIVVADLTRFKPVRPLSVTSTRQPGLVYIFQIDLTAEEFHRRRPHDEEIASVHLFSFAEVAGMIERGEIYVVLPLALIMRYWLMNGIVGLN